MPTYDYICPKCDCAFDVVLSIRAYSQETVSQCPSCENPCGKDDRDFKKMRRTHFIGTSVQNAEFNPGLGCVVKNRAHKDELMKEKGVVEVGNDYGSAEKMDAYFQKRKEEEREKRWEDPDDFFTE